MGNSNEKPSENCTNPDFGRMNALQRLNFGDNNGRVVLYETNRDWTRHYYVYYDDVITRREEYFLTRAPTILFRVADKYFYNTVEFNTYAEANRARENHEQRERARVEREAAERARVEREEAERKRRIEREAAERARVEREEAERRRTEAEAEMFQSRRVDVIERFNREIELEFSRESYSTMQSVMNDLEDLVDQANMNEPEIIHRLLITAIRVGRYELMFRLEEASDEELQDAVLDLLEDEISLLDAQSMRGGNVREYYKQLKKIDDKVNNVRQAASNRVEIEGIAGRVLRQASIHEESARENLLAKEVNQEKG